MILYIENYDFKFHDLLPLKENLVYQVSIQILKILYSKIYEIENQ